MPIVECEHELFAEHTCYDDSAYFKGTMTFTGDNSSHAYTYVDSEQVQDQAWRGKYGSYPGGGFVVDLPLNLTQTLAILTHLRDIVWLDGGTRFLAMDFNTYNPSTSLHTVARLAWEMPTGGLSCNISNMLFVL